jgi:hypothetical protein
MGFIFISIQVTALDKTAMRKGIIVGPFVIFGKYS